MPATGGRALRFGPGCRGLRHRSSARWTGTFRTTRRICRRCWRCWTDAISSAAAGRAARILRCVWCPLGWPGRFGPGALGTTLPTPAVRFGLSSVPVSKGFSHSTGCIVFFRYLWPEMAAGSWRFPSVTGRGYRVSPNTASGTVWDVAFSTWSGWRGFKGGDWIELTSLEKVAYRGPVRRLRGNLR